MTPLAPQDWQRRLITLIAKGLRDRRGDRLLVPRILRTFERIGADPDLSRWFEGLSEEELVDQFQELYELEGDSEMP